MHSYDTQDLCTDTFNEWATVNYSPKQRLIVCRISNAPSLLAGAVETSNQFPRPNCPGFVDLKLGDKWKGKPPAAKKKMSCSKSQCLVYYIFYLHFPPKLSRSGSMDPRLSVFGIFLLRIPGVAQQDVRPRRDSESATEGLVFPGCNDLTIPCEPVTLLMVLKSGKNHLGCIKTCK